MPGYTLANFLSISSPFDSICSCAGQSEYTGRKKKNFLTSIVYALGETRNLTNVSVSYYTDGPSSPSCNGQYQTTSKLVFMFIFFYF